MRVVSAHFIQKPNRIDESQAKHLGRYAVMQIKLPLTEAVWNGPALICITRMCIQCGRIQCALLRIIMCIVGLVWTGL